MVAKTNNRRRWPDANHQPNHLAEFRKTEAKVRQKAYDVLTLEEKIEKLPPTGAKKQRARLMLALEKQKAPKQVVVAAVPVKKDDIVSDSKLSKQEKKYMRGSK